MLTWLLLLAPAVPPASAGPLDPLKVRTQLLYQQIYDTTTWARRIPYALAMPVVARARLGDWLEDLDLEEEVRQRAVERIESKVLVDEIIPFLIAVRQTYATENDTVAPFDRVLRERYAPDEPIPGMQHSMFQWQDGSSEKKAERRDGFAIDDRVASRIVTLYDALYLRHVEPNARLEAELASCSLRDDLAELRTAVDRSAPIVRGLIEDVRDQLDLEGEVATMVDRVLTDPERLETVTASGIRFIDRLVCRSYGVFATRLQREQQLRNWLLGELRKSDGGEIWQYLQHAEHERRYGVLVVVDGLQGGLVEALVGGENRDSFVSAVDALYRRHEGAASEVRGLHTAPAQQTDFLDSLQRQPFRDPRYLPFFRDLYRDSGPSDLRRPLGVALGGISTTPTISVRNLPISWTGAPVAGPGGSGIPNFHFVDREYRRRGVLTGRPYYFFGNDAMLLLPLTRKAGMRSLFDRMPLLSSFSCAAQYDDAAHYSIDAFVNLALGETVRDFAERLCMAELETRANHERRLHELRRELIEDRDELTRDVPLWRVFSRIERRDRRKLAEHKISEIARLEQRTLPELLVYYNPWPDHFSHFKGPFSDEIISPSGELARLDHWLGALGGFYRDAGIEGRTLFAMAGDHGLAPIFHTLNPEVVVFDALRREGIDFRVAKISSDEGEGPKLNSVFEPPTMKGYDVV
ncbi:MAG: hypothetical protein GY733_19315, partial [bacterium]|nr:hypothetical protein [bacterium]